MGAKGVFFLRVFSLNTIQGIVNQTWSRLRLQWRKLAFVLFLGLVAHYFGFVWALTNFNPFYSDWLFFIDLSLGYIFALALAALIVQILISTLAFLNTVFSLFWPDQLMRASRVANFSIPFLRIQALNYAAVGNVFLLIVLILYTSMEWWQIIIAMALVPIFTYIWGYIAYRNIRYHQVEELEFDLGANFELGAENIGQLLSKVEKVEAELEAQLLEALPEDVSELVAQVLRNFHAFTAKIGEYIPEKEAIAEDITNLQFMIKDLRWDIAYARFAMPKIRSILIGIFIGASMWVGYSHEERFVKNHEVEIEFKNGKRILATPITQRGIWQVYVQNGKLDMINKEEIYRLNPKPKSPW